MSLVTVLREADAVIERERIIETSSDSSGIMMREVVPLAQRKFKKGHNHINYVTSAWRLWLRKGRARVPPGEVCMSGHPP